MERSEAGPPASEPTNNAPGTDLVPVLTVPTHLFPQRRSIVSCKQVEGTLGYEQVEIAQHYLNRCADEFFTLVEAIRASQGKLERARMVEFVELGSLVAESVAPLLDNEERDYQVQRAQAMMLVSLAEKMMAIVVASQPEAAGTAHKMANLGMELNEKAIQILGEFLKGEVTREQAIVASSMLTEFSYIYRQNRS